MKNPLLENKGFLFTTEFLKAWELLILLLIMSLSFIEAIIRKMD